MDPTTLSAREALALIERGELSADEVYGAYHERCLDDTTGSLLWIADKPPLSSGGPLGGLPLGVKDIFCQKDVETRAASRILEGYLPPYTAHVVERLVDHGARVVARTNMDEFGMGGSNENSAYFPVKNPHDPTRVAGGSSGGSAAALAARLVPFAIGSDTGGSIRQPASFCGVVGLKPTYGSCSRYGMISFASSLDCPGPMAKTVADCALLFEAMVGFDRRDATSRHHPDPTIRFGEDLKGVRVGLIRELLGDGIDNEVRDAALNSAKRAQALGAEIVEVTLPHLEYAVAAYYLISSSEASTNLARYDGIRYGNSAPAATLGERYRKTRSTFFGDEVKRRIMLGTFALSSGYYEAYYARAQKVRTLLRRDFDRAFETADLLLSPTAPTTAYPFGSRSDVLSMYLGDVCTVPASLAGLPALSVPIGKDASSLPIGLQLVGPAFSEAKLFEAAALLEER